MRFTIVNMANPKGSKSVVLKNHTFLNLEKFKDEFQKKCKNNEGCSQLPEFHRRCENGLLSISDLVDILLQLHSALTPKELNRLHERIDRCWGGSCGTVVSHTWSVDKDKLPQSNANITTTN